MDKPILSIEYIIIIVIINIITITIIIIIIIIIIINNNILLLLYIKQILYTFLFNIRNYEIFVLVYDTNTKEDLGR